MKRLLPALLLLLLARTASPHDLTDPTVRGHSTSVELQVWHDRLLVDVWIQMSDIAALEWRGNADADGDRKISDDEAKTKLALDRAVYLEWGLSLEVAGADGKLALSKLHLDKETVDLKGDDAVGDTTVKVNFQWSVEGFVPAPDAKTEAVLTAVNPFSSTRLTGRVIREGNITVVQPASARTKFDEAWAGVNASTGKGGLILDLEFTIPSKFAGQGDFWTHDGRWVDMATGKLFAERPAHGLLERLSRFWEKKILAFLRSGESPPLGLAAFVLGIAFLYGAAHAVGPGHGKSLVAAYLVGSHGRVGHAVLLGLVVTVSHVGVVVAVGLALWVFKISDEAVKRWISLASGATIVAMGAWLLYTRWRFGLQHAHGPGGHTHLPGEGHSHGHDHLHGHEHPHDHHHSHVHAHDAGPGGDIETIEPVSEVPRIAAWDLITTGILGGMVPCPAAFVILLMSLAVNRVAWGLLLICAFSLGLGGVLTGIGILLLLAKKFMARHLTGGHAWLRRAAIASSVFILALGILLTIQAIRDLRA